MIFTLKNLKNRSLLIQYIINLTKTVELNSLTKKIYILYLRDSNLVYYLLNVNINMDDVRFETNHRNGLIYILTYIEKGKKVLTQEIGLAFCYNIFFYFSIFLWYLNLNQWIVTNYPVAVL